MKNWLMILLLFVCSSFAIAPFTYKWTINLAGDTATVAKWRANNDSVLNFCTRLTDTLNKKIPRWIGFSNHDSTFKWMNIDTIPSADTICVKKIKIDTASISYMNNLDSIKATYGKFRQTKITDSLIFDQVNDSEVVLKTVKGLLTRIKINYKKGNFSFGDPVGKNTTGTNVIFIGGGTVPTDTAINGGGYLYNDYGALKWKSPAGTVTTIAPN
jgi:hypothetical protein